MNILKYIRYTLVISFLEKIFFFQISYLYLDSQTFKTMSKPSELKYAVIGIQYIIKYDIFTNKNATQRMDRRWLICFSW